MTPATLCKLLVKLKNCWNGSWLSLWFTWGRSQLAKHQWGSSSWVTWCKTTILIYFWPNYPLKWSLVAPSCLLKGQVGFEAQSLLCGGQFSSKWAVLWTDLRYVFVFERLQVYQNPKAMFLFAHLEVFRSQKESLCTQIRGTGFNIPFLWRHLWLNHIRSF